MDPLLRAETVFTLPEQHAHGTTDDDTNSTTFENIDEMTLTVSKTGTYFVAFTMSLAVIQAEVTPTVAIVYCQLLKDDVLQKACMLGINATPAYYVTSYGCVAINVVLSLTAGEIVKVQWKVNHADVKATCEPATTPTAYHRELSLVRIG